MKGQLKKILSKDTLLQFIKFGVVGVSNTLIALAVYYLCIFLGMHYIMANTLGFLISVINAYFWNSKFVFRQNNKRNLVTSFGKVFMSYGFTFLLGTLLLYLWVDVFEISDKIAPLINLCITTPLNFLLNKFWAMKTKRNSDNAGKM